MLFAKEGSPKYVRHSTQSIEDTIIQADLVSTSTARDEYGEFTTYQILCASQLGDRWTVSKRYSDFVNLAKSLAGSFSLPRKRLINSRTDKVVKERTEKLRAFLLQALRDFREAPAFVHFLHPGSISPRQLRSRVSACEQLLEAMQDLEVTPRGRDSIKYKTMRDKYMQNMHVLTYCGLTSPSSAISERSSRNVAGSCLTMQPPVPTVDSSSCYQMSSPNEQANVSSSDTADALLVKQVVARFKTDPRVLSVLAARRGQNSV
eukprot:SAG31_NODE_339_length_17487_cov_20.764435_4_plen_262_part_00